MDTLYLAIITVIMLVISALATGSAISNKTAKKDNDLNLNTLSAESLLEVVADKALIELFEEGDAVEIVIKTNGRTVAGKEYLVTSLCGHTKLVTESALKISGQTA